MDATTKAIAHVLRQWNEAGPQSAQIIDLESKRKERIKRNQKLRSHRQPPPEAA